MAGCTRQRKALAADMDFEAADNLQRLVVDMISAAQAAYQVESVGLGVEAIVEDRGVPQIWDFPVDFEGSIVGGRCE